MAEGNERMEKDYFATAYHAFSQYKSFICDKIQKTEGYVMCLPEHHQQLLSDYKNNLGFVKECVEKNQMVLDTVLQGVPFIFENMSYDDFLNKDDKNAVKKITREEIKKVETVLKQLFREWSKAGYAEREASFRPIVDEILLHFPRDKCVPDRVNVLVPGAGLGRLAFEIARLGYSCQGNEFSLYMLFTSNFLLNRCKDTNLYTIHPWVHHFSNNMCIDDQSKSVSFPDISPWELRGKKQSFSMTAGDFTEIYDSENEWDCIATCFFIDCAENVIKVIETIHKILKPGGIWVNLGPLMYHFSIIEDINAVSPSYHELKNIISHFGFCFEKEEVSLKTSYCQNPDSMLKSQYESVFFVCRKSKSSMNTKQCL